MRGLHPAAVGRVLVPECYVERVNLECLAFQRLLADQEAGKADVVVAYLRDVLGKLAGGWPQRRLSTLRSLAGGVG
jgi:hypothetical protein